MSMPSLCTVNAKINLPYEYLHPFNFKCENRVVLPTFPDFSSLLSGISELGCFFIYFFHGGGGGDCHPPPPPPHG